MIEPESIWWNYAQVSFWVFTRNLRSVNLMADQQKPKSKRSRGRDRAAEVDGVEETGPRDETHRGGARGRPRDRREGIASSVNKLLSLPPSAYQ